MPAVADEIGADAKDEQCRDHAKQDEPLPSPSRKCSALRHLRVGGVAPDSIEIHVADRRFRDQRAAITKILGPSTR